MLLPKPINRARLRAFWLLVTVAASSSVMLVRWVLDLWSGVNTTVLWLGLLLVLGAPGFLWPYRVQWVYRGWNFGARRAGRYIERYLTAVCFLTVVLPMSLGSPATRFERFPQSGTMWRPRGTQNGAAYSSQYTDDRGSPQGAAWSRSFLRWCRVSGHAQARVLLPFLWLLRLVDTNDDERRPVQGNIYTLY